MTPAKRCIGFCAAIVALLASFVLASGASAQAQPKPNILIIWGDDIGYWNVSAYTRA